MHISICRVMIKYQRKGSGVKVMMEERDNKTALFPNYYLVDYENVHMKGLEGMEDISTFDHIYIFFTKHMHRKERRFLVYENYSHIEGIEVAEGKESVDKHILAYMGYLMSVIDKNSKIYIVSQDKGYDKIAQFMENRTGVVVERIPKIRYSPSKIEFASDEDYDSVKLFVEQDVAKWLRFAGFISPTTYEVSEVVTRLYGDLEISSKVYIELRDMYENCDEVYDAIKPLLINYAREAQVNSSKQLNHVDVKEQLSEVQIRKLMYNSLCNQGFSDTIIEHVSSVAMNRLKIKNNKYWTHRVLVADYGQDKGTQMYRCIRRYI